MSQPPYSPDDTQPGSWGPPPPGGYQAPSYTRPSGVPQSPAHHYSADPYGSQPYGGQPYGAPPYGGQPGGWQEQQYGYPGYDPYGQPLQRGNGMAVAGFVLSFFVGVLGLIFSIIGLRHSSDPGRGGRGLAIAGIVISALNMAFWALVLLGLGARSTTPDGTAGSTLDAAGSSPTSAAPAPGSETVKSACHVIIPAVTGAQADLQSATSVSDMLDKVNRLADKIEQYGAATRDAAFTKDTTKLATEYRALLHDAQTGRKPDFTTLAKAGEQVGFDCGRVGVFD